MTWPYSRLTTYVASNTPSIKAADLNSIQDALIVAGLQSPAISTGYNTMQARLVDAGGNSRMIFDHLGYQMGRISDFRENWLFPISDNGGSIDQATVSPNWYTYVAGSGSQTLSSLSPSSSSQGNEVKFHGAANLDQCHLYTTTNVLMPNGAVSFAMEWEAYMTSTGTNHATFYMGLSNSVNPPANAQHLIQFGWTSGGTEWTYNTSDGATLDGFNGSVVVVANQWHKFRLEYHGSSTPWGVASVESVGANTAKARFFVDGTRVGTLGTHMPSVAMKASFGSSFTGTTPADLHLSQVKWSYNRFVSGL